MYRRVSTNRGIYREITFESVFGRNIKNTLYGCVRGQFGYYRRAGRLSDLAASLKEFSTCITMYLRSIRRMRNHARARARDAVIRLNRRKSRWIGKEEKRKEEGSAVEKRIKESGMERKIRREGHQTNSRWLVSLYTFPGIGLIYRRTLSYLPRSVSFS